LASVGRVRSHVGQYADVVVDVGRGVARRVPRYEAERAALPGLVAKLRAASALALPAPPVLGADLEGPLGVAHVELGYVPGVGLRHPSVACLPAAGRERLVRDLTGLLSALRDADLARWPAGDDGRWAERWLALRRDVAELVVPRLAPAGVARALADADAAVAAAADAPIALAHGDLGGENVRVDPATGALTGVLDWDSAGPGDPAVDLAALSVSVPAPVVERLPATAGDALRARAYARTFALQDAVFGLRRGDAEAARAGLAPYRGADP
jgi:aminoglycoside phosphotransferase (APT) family kinase protein